MKKLVFSLVVVALLLAIAVPVMAKGPWDWNKAIEDGWAWVLPFSPDDNEGCSADFWVRHYNLIPDAEKGRYDALSAKGVAMEEAAAYINLAYFEDPLPAGMIAAAVDAAGSSGKAGKGYVEYLKLWNKGYLLNEGTAEEPVYVTEKNCPIPNFPESFPPEE
jgi:hypothetical protein